jgi:2-methylisocitrate lyase-like PEP mutase family enzyme
MTDSSSKQFSAANVFRTLHESGCFALPNPWDPGTAVYLQHLGFVALATSSAGFAFSRGLPDTVTAVTRDGMLAHIREVVQATPLPVNADFQNGYADEPEDVAANVTLCLATGVAGLSIEDARGDPVAPLYETGMAIERIKAARNAVDASGLPVILTARCEAFLVGHPEPLRVVLERLTAFAEAGADCLYAPGVSQAAEIAAIVKAVAPKPVNVLMPIRGQAFSMAELANLGVRRVSVGSGLARAAWGAFIRAARGIAEAGTFDAFAGAAPFNELDALFSRSLKE